MTFPRNGEHWREDRHVPGHQGVLVPSRILAFAAADGHPPLGSAGRSLVADMVNLGGDAGHDRAVGFVEELEDFELQTHSGGISREGCDLAK